MSLYINKCNNQIEVNDSNFIYYYFQEFPEMFSTYNYFMGVKIQGNYYMFFTNRSTRGALQYSNANTFYVYADTTNNVYYYLNDNTNLNTITYSMGGVSLGKFYIATDPYFTNNDFGNINRPLNSNITKQDLEDYFYCPVVVPDYETKNVVFNSFLVDSVSIIPLVLVLILIFNFIGKFINKKDF